MDLLQAFTDNVQSKHLFTNKDRLLVATSGGLDSVVLCKLCSLAGYKFAIAHCNFQLRGADSQRDEDFVKELAASLNVAFFSTSFDTKKFVQDEKLSTQEAARLLRYKWFEKIRVENDFAYILTAHHADDNIETLLMTFLRGTGIKGLTGIQEQNGKLVRPLLFAKKETLEFFLKQHQLEFVQDESNLHDDYTRNYLRNTIMPMLTKMYPQVQNNLLANIGRMKDAELLYRVAVDREIKKMLSFSGDDRYIPVSLLQKSPAPRTLLFEIIKQFGFSAAQLPDAMSLLESASGKQVLSASHRLLRNRQHLIISPKREKETSFVMIEAPGSFSFKEGVVKITEVEVHSKFMSNDPLVAFVDAADALFPMVLRPWKTGDYFYPLGMRKKKKISRFFIDQKFSLSQKEKIWVLETGKKIVWVAGHRIDDRFKITGGTKRMLRLELITQA